MSRVDSNIIVSTIVEDDMKSDAERILFKIPKSYDEIFIPQIVLGEAFIKVFQESPEEKRERNIKKFYTCILETVKNPWQHTPPLCHDIFKIAEEIRLVGNDYKMEYNDIMLTAYAITDSQATALYTFDTRIHQSWVIQNMIEERGNRLRILDYVP